VWTLADAEPFLADAAASCLLMTTRNREIALSLRARGVPINALSYSQSLEILAQWTEIPVAQLPPEAEEIVRKCGRLPLALAMVGGLVHTGLLNGRLDAWVIARYRLEGTQLDSIRFPLEHYPYPGLMRAIQVSVDALQPRSRDRYLMMSVFPDDVPVPESTLRILWDVDEYEMQSTVDSWLAASLATRNDQGRISLHDLQLDFARKVTTPARITALHQLVVRHYAASCGGDWSKAPNDGYFFQRIAWHMAGAENWSELANMLLCTGYIRAKLDALTYLEFGHDFRWSASCLSVLKTADEQRLFKELESSVQQLAGFIDRKEETARVERWIEADERPCLLIQGPAGIGKGWLMRHLWVRSLRTSILGSFSIRDGRTNVADVLTKMLVDIPARIPSHEVSNELASASDRILYELRRVLAESPTKCFFVDGVDEVDQVRLVDDFLQVVVQLAKTQRFIIAGRSCKFFDDLEAQFPGSQILVLGELPRADVVTLLTNALRARGLSGDEKMLERVIQYSSGNPLIVSLIAHNLQEGRSMEELLGDLERPPPDPQFLVHRIIIRLVAGGMPEEMLRTLASRLLKGQDTTLEKLQQEFGASDSVMQALGSSAMFWVKPAGERNIIQALPYVLEALRSYYALTDRGPQHGLSQSHTESDSSIR
jgi:hypothetical protein